MNLTPTIGLPADRRIIDPHPFHIVGEKYITAVRNGSGGVPFLIPALGDSVSPERILERLDGLLMTGSPSNVEPRHYAGARSKPGTMHDPARDATSLPLLEQALAGGVPLLCVCRGFQELNVVLGGSLHQEVHKIPGYAMHKEDPDAALEVQYGPAHDITLTEGGLLRQLAGAGRVSVNSLHAQGVDRLAAGVTVEAVADDGLVEGFRVDNAPGFALAVQWHPEWQFEKNEFSTAIFQAFGKACAERAAQRSYL